MIGVACAAGAIGLVLLVGRWSNRDLGEFDPSAAPSNPVERATSYATNDVWSAVPLATFCAYTFGALAARVL